jgi:ribosome-binding protein aMBF1 (putative translation factor)
LSGNTSLKAAKGFKAKLTALKNKASGVTKTSQEAAGISMDSRVALSRAQMEKWSAAAQATQGMGKILESALQYFSKMEEANKTEIEAEASKLRYLVQDQDQLVKNANEWEQDVRRKLAEIINMNNQVMSRIFQV